jgi:hypothetical protein
LFRPVSKLFIWCTVTCLWPCIVAGQIRVNASIAPVADVDFNFAVKDLPLVSHSRPVIINRNPFLFGIGFSSPSNRNLAFVCDIRYVVRTINYLDNHVISSKFFFNSMELTGELNRTIARFTDKSIQAVFGAGVNKVITPASHSAWREDHYSGGYTYEFRLDSDPYPSYFFRLGTDFQVDFSPDKALSVGVGAQYQHTPTFFVEEEVIGLQRVARSKGIRPHYFYLRIAYAFQVGMKKAQ